MKKLVAVAVLLGDSLPSLPRGCAPADPESHSAATGKARVALIQDRARPVTPSSDWMLRPVLEFVALLSGSAR